MARSLGDPQTPSLTLSCCGETGIGRARVGACSRIWVAHEGIERDDEVGQQGDDQQENSDDPERTGTS